MTGEIRALIDRICTHVSLEHHTVITSVITTVAVLIAVNVFPLRAQRRRDHPACRGALPARSRRRRRGPDQPLQRALQSGRERGVVTHRPEPATCGEVVARGTDRGGGAEGGGADRVRRGQGGALGDGAQRVGRGGERDAL